MVEGVITKIPSLVIKEIQAAKAWKLILLLTVSSSKIGMISLLDLAWHLMGNPWWMFKSDNLETRESKVVVWKNVL